MPWECEDCGYPGCGDANCLDTRARSDAEQDAIYEKARARRGDISLPVEAASNPNLLKGNGNDGQESK